MQEIKKQDFLTSIMNIRRKLYNPLTRTFQVDYTICRFMGKCHSQQCIPETRG